MSIRQLGAIIALLIALAACAPATPTAAPIVSPQAGTTSAPAPLPPTSGGTLRIALLPITDVMPYYIAEAQGYFKQQGLNVELLPVSSAAERDQLIITQQADGAMTDLMGNVVFNAQSLRLKVVRTVRTPFPNAPMFYVITPKDSAVKSVQDLKGKEIAISQNTVIDYLTQRLLESEGLTAADIKTTNVPAIPTRLQLVQQGQVAASVLPDPFASLAILQGARVVIDDTKHPELSISVTSFRTDIVEKRPDDVRKFIAAYDKAVNDIRAKPEQFKNILIEKGRVPDPLKDKYQFPPFPDPSVPTKAQWDDVVKWCIGRKLISTPVTYESSVDTGFVK